MPVHANELETVLLRNTYAFECYDSQGNLKWSEQVPNLVTNEGLNDLLNKYLKGSSYTAAFYVGLIDNSGFGALAAGDTAAKITLTANSPTTNDWQEADDYSESVRQTLTLGTVASQSVNNSASKAAYSINGTVTVKGAFIVTSSTKGGTSGVLYGEAAFSTARAMLSGDTLNVTCTLTSASA